ncbi:MAG: leucyl aminopeptidase [Alphaproteobacteria bacterium]|nr:leucyl aminopeptidase [Alphaproteobacteria bacterium]
MVEFVFDSKPRASSAVRVIVCASNVIKCEKFCSDKELKTLKDSVKTENFKAEFGAFAGVFDGKNKIILAGTGEKPSLLDVQILGGKIYQKIKNFQNAEVLVASNAKSKISASDIACNLAFGIELGGYRFDKYFTTKKESDFPKLEKVHFCAEGEKLSAVQYNNLHSVANAVRYARDLCNEPANYLTPQVFADDIKRLEYLGLKVKILEEKQIRAEGMNMLLAVAKGSHNSPRVAVLRWEGAKKSEANEFGLVGKGVTFDSGGISLKPSTRMCEMKGDMTGSAVVVATMKAAALCKVKQNITAVVGLVENMPSGHASRPGDVVTSMSGQTVEIIDTDAEGRLVLGDCLWYLQKNFAVKNIIDVATLTGSTMRTFGFEYAGLFSNNDKLAEKLYAKGLESGEKLWRLPVTKEYDKMIDSDIADMKNLGPMNGGGITAACFLQRFVKKENAWAHLDIAGVDLDDKGHPLTPKGATAFGVRVLSKMVGCY